MWWLACVALALLGVVFVLRATTRGAGVSPDSTAYISMAREMLLPFGFSLPIQPRDDFPPLYPALLAFGGVITGDPATAARFIGALLFGGNILLVGLILKRILPHSFFAPLLGATLMLISVTMLQIHFMAWSEPAFLFLGMCGMIALASYIERQQVWQLLVAAVTIGLAAMDRYVGISLAFTGIGALILLTPGSLRRKFASAILFAAIAYLPFSAWMTHQPTRRMLTFRIPPPEYFQMGFETVSLWVLPGANPLLVMARPWLIAGILVLLALGVLYVWRYKSRQASPQVLVSRIPPLFYIVTLFLILYPLAHLTAKVFFSPSITLHSRALSPVFVSGLIVFISMVTTIFTCIRAGRVVLRIALATLLLVVLWNSFGQAWRYVERIRVEGLEYNSQAWHASPTIARIKTLPPNLVIISNGSDAIYFLTGRTVQRTPNKVDKLNLVENQAYLAEMERIKNQLAAGRAVIVYFNTFPDRWFQPNEQDLRHDLPLRLIAREADGAIFE